MSVRSFNLNTTAKLSSVGKEYICFENDGKSAQAAKCVKSRIKNEVIYCVVSINTFKPIKIVMKGMLQSPRLKYHMKTIVIDQSLSKSALFGHRCIQNIKKIYKRASRCEYQQQFKDVLEATMVSTPEGFINNSPGYSMTPTPVKKPSARKSLCIY